jgi:hypothetical protein
MKMENLIKIYLESQSNIKSVEFIPNANGLFNGKIVPGSRTLVKINRKGFNGDTNSIVLAMNEIFNLELGTSDSKFRVVVL